MAQNYTKMADITSDHNVNNGLFTLFTIQAIPVISGLNTEV